MIFDQNRLMEKSSYGEAVRLSNELRSKPSLPMLDENGIIIGMSEPIIGFDCETADYLSFTNWLNNTTKKKSQSLFWFVIRMMAWRFPEKHTKIRNNLSERRRLEFDLILSQMKKEIEWVGLTGYQNMVELNPDSLLNLKNIRVVKLNDDRYRFERK